MADKRLKIEPAHVPGEVYRPLNYRWKSTPGSSVRPVKVKPPNGGTGVRQLKIRPIGIDE